MVTSAKITSKGQITLPKEVRKLLDVQSGSVVVFEKEENRIVIKQAQTFRGFRGLLKNRGNSSDFKDARKKAKEYIVEKTISNGKR